jgi:glycosyltransferase involved in cell wall biosynthesis
VKILIMRDFYLPGYKSGGPIRTIANLVDRLGNEFECKIVTSDRDSGDRNPYPNIKTDDWNRVGQADVFYMSSKTKSLRSFRKLIKTTEHDVLYLNSFFSPHFSIKLLILRKLGLVLKTPLIVAPRGELSKGAIGIKSIKKRIYIIVAKAIGLYDNVIWQASSSHEEEDIKKYFGDMVHIMIAPNLSPRFSAVDEKPHCSTKQVGKLKIIFLSRISKMKNLEGALSLLKDLAGTVQFDIYGPIEDKGYWAGCQRIIGLLPSNVQVNYCGSVEHLRVSGLMQKYELFFLPTLGENFGHVILEAFCAGLPVLISNLTRWRDLEKEKVGWDIPLKNSERFQSVLQNCVGMDHKEHFKLSTNAWKYGNNYIQDDKVLEQNRRLFQSTVSV